MGVATEERADIAALIQGMPQKHVAFCFQYIATGIDRNGKQAYLKVYPKVKQTTAEVNASKLLRNAKVCQLIDALESEGREICRKTRDEILQEVENIGFSRLTDFIEWNESGIAFLKNSNEIPPEIAGCIESLQVVEEQMPIPGTGKNGKEVMRTVLKTKVKLHPKMAALTNLMKYHGMLTDKVEHEHGPQTVNVVHYEGASKRVAPPGQAPKPEKAEAPAPKPSARKAITKSKCIKKVKVNGNGKH